MSFFEAVNEGEKRYFIGQLPKDIASRVEPFPEELRAQIISKELPKSGIRLGRRGESDSASSLSPSPSPSHSVLFSRGAWPVMLRSLGISQEQAKVTPPPPYSSNARLLSTYNIAFIKRQKVSQKIPALALIIKDLKPSEQNAKVRFADPTGEISGTIHKRVVEEFTSEIRVGTVLVLKKITAFSPRPKSHYLNITRDNITNIFPPEAHAPAARQHDPPPESSPDAVALEADLDTLSDFAGFSDEELNP